MDCEQEHIEQINEFISNAVEAEIGITRKLVTPLSNQDMINT